MDKMEMALGRIESSLTQLFNPNQGNKVVDVYIPLEHDFGSGNDTGMGAVYRTKKGNYSQNVFRGTKYTDYQREVTQALIDLYSDGAEWVMDLKEVHGVDDVVAADKELTVQIIFFMDKGTLTKRSTKDLDNMTKPTLDAMQKALNFDDAQITKLQLEKRISTQKALSIQIWQQ